MDGITVIAEALQVGRHCLQMTIHQLIDFFLCAFINSTLLRGLALGDAAFLSEAGLDRAWTIDFVELHH